MSRPPIFTLFQQMQKQLASAHKNLTLDQERHIEVGRVYATELIAALRAGSQGPNILMGAIALLGKTDENQLIGFLMEIEDWIAERS